MFYYPDYYHCHHREWESKLITPIASLPLSLDYVKQNINWYSSDTTNDTRLENLQWEAIDFIERYLNRSLLTQTRQQIRSSWGGIAPFFNYYFQGASYPQPVNTAPYVMHLPRPPLQSVSSITYYDTNNTLQTLSSSLYTVITDDNGPGRVVRNINATYPAVYPREDCITIQYVSGWTSLPWSIQRAICLLIGHFNESREAASDKQLYSIPFGVENLLNAYEWGAM